MTAINIWRNNKPSRISHGPIQPMSRHDRTFWQWRAERKELEKKNER